MSLTVATIRAMGRSFSGRRKLRYAAASVSSAVVGQAVLLSAFGAFRWSARDASLLSFLVAAGLSYHVNRAWVWGRRGRSHLLREVVPFWTIAAVGLALSMTGIVLAEQAAASMTANHALRTGAVMGASCASVLTVWALKYLVLDRYVFVARMPTLGGNPVERLTGGTSGPVSGQVPVARVRS